NYFLALQDRQVVIGHLQNDEGHAGAVVAAGRIADPGAVLLAHAQKLVADGGIPIAPVAAAGNPHGLYGVVMAIEVMLLFAEQVAAIAAGLEAPQKIEAFGHFLAF